MDIKTAIIFLPGFLAAITIHEAAHALVSKWLGDRHAESQGRISLNPIRHLSPMGTALLFLVGFGWGKPVPVNLYNYKHPKLYYLISSLAGPISNLLLATVLFSSLFLFRFFGLSTESIVGDIVLYGVMINLLLMFINLIPIPPLDGSKIWPCLIPRMRPIQSDKAMKFWFIILIAIFLFQIPSKMANYAGKRLSGYVVHKMKQIRPHFPQEMKAPQYAYGTQYSNAKNKNGEPNSFSTRFCMNEPYPANTFRENIASQLSIAGWSFVQSNIDPNKPWEISEVLTDDDKGTYCCLMWDGCWKKNSKTLFKIYLKYYTDPNGQNLSDYFVADYQYIIQDN